MERLFLAIACMLVHIPSIFIRFAPFRELVTPRRRRTLLLLYTPVLALIALVYYMVYDTDFIILFHKIMMLVTAALLAAINILVIPGHWREHLFTSALASIHVSISFYTSAYIVRYIPGIDSPVRIVACAALVTFVLFLILRHFYCNATRRVVTPFLRMDCGDYWNRIWYTPIGLFLASFFSASLTSYSASIPMLLSRLFLWVTTILWSNAIARDHVIMRQRLEMAEQLNLQREYYHGLTERVAEARKSRHDFKHHMAAIRRFLDRDDKQGLLEYMEELQIVVDQGLPVPYTGNQALDGVLYRYATLARKNGIRFEFGGVMEKLAMPSTDLCVLLGNALDNALTGCLTLDTDRFISVTARSGGAEQTLLITNSFDGLVELEEEQILSRKRDHEPGIGLESMRSICEKNNALMDVRYDDRTFNVLLVIPTKIENP